MLFEWAYVDRRCIAASIISVFLEMLVDVQFQQIAEMTTALSKE
jgi:hypothetical protein